ncbi:enoyl-CoA hydratase/isomerase family protein [Sphingobacterium psychroaquaticum]|uniref:Enoyl-CoA hydratase/carnithine racemase n=1 Tax=Sphingobacterium psychroaquaticum TaxID=561061 RepID=A0A1X7L168_9SPHI|nr:enoyl-CoA hydratase/isomerase family protein [Sphingobacterium psychroaquaticum]QBQ39776.1 enoyl-CoA hydratase/isomerase family protein [Sphingobacterium psychroaquaticum]SMG47254.1 Enoyl-CoA hydratase/carnithine racemase [Sphingobacterium psychroaquaticum]
MGEFVKTNNNEHIAFIALDRGKSNALHLEMVQELQQEIERAKDNPAIEAIIIHGKEGFFSSGLDLITLYSYDEATMKKFWEAFMDLIYSLTSFPKPAVASITGHSPAGGCVLAICCDYRVMAEGEYIIGLNEIPVGITVPSSIFALYSFWLGQATAYRSLLEGKLRTPKEALDSHLIDELVPADRVNTAATRKAKAAMQYDKNAWGTTKLNLRKELLEKMLQDKEIAIQQVLEQWWRPSTRAILKTIIENLTKKKA